MKAEDRENKLYTEGKRCAIAMEETFMMELLGKGHDGSNSLLDIGCGTGEISFALREQNFKPYGIDFSDRAIELATKAGLDCQVVDVDEGIPLKDETFDVVWAGDVVEHVFDPINMLEETNRLLKDKGRFFATIPHDLNWKTRVRVLIGQSFQDAVYRKYGQFKHHTFFSESLMKFMYQKANIKIKSIHYVVTLPIIGKTFITTNSLFRLFSYLMIVEGVKEPLPQEAPSKIVNVGV